MSVGAVIQPVLELAAPSPGKTRRVTVRQDIHAGQTLTPFRPGGDRGNWSVRSPSSPAPFHFPTKS